MADARAFAPLFEAGYLTFLHGSPTSAALARLRDAVSTSEDLRGDLAVLLADANWRPHLVAAAAMVARPDAAPLDPLWGRLSTWSWACPQLAAAASVVDPDYAPRAEAVLRRLCAESLSQDGRALVGPGKIAASLAAFLPSFRDPAFPRLAAADETNAAKIATRWLASFRAALAQP